MRAIQDDMLHAYFSLSDVTRDDLCAATVGLYLMIDLYQLTYFSGFYLCIASSGGRFPQLDRVLFLVTFSNN